MLPFRSPDDYLFNLYATNSGDAKRLWRQQIKEKWNNRCAYCESEKDLTIDHIIPRSKGGTDFINNVVSCCNSCNSNKGHINWEDWFSNQDFFTKERRDAILTWMKGEPEKTLYKYPQRKNKVI